MTAGELCVLQIKPFRCQRKARVQLVADGSMTLPYHVTIAIRKSSRIFLLLYRKPDLHRQIMQVSCQTIFLIVVVNFALLQGEMTHAQLEDVEISGRRLASRWMRQIGLSIAIGKYTHDRPLYFNIIHVPLAVP